MKLFSYSRLVWAFVLFRQCKLMGQGYLADELAWCGPLKSPTRPAWPAELMAALLHMRR